MPKFKIHLFTLIATIYLLFSSGFIWSEADAQLKAALRLVKTQCLSTENKISALQIKGTDGRWYDMHGLTNVFALMPAAFLGSIVEKIINVDINQLLFFLSSLIGIIVNSFTCLVFFSILYLFGRSLKTCFYSTMCLAFLTIIFAYACKSYEGNLNTLFILSSLYFLFNFLEKKHFFLLVLCGIFTGLSINTRDFSWLFLICITVFMLWISWEQRKPKAILIFLIVLLPFLILWMYYNLRTTGVFYLSPMVAYILRVADVQHLPSGSILSGLKGLLLSKGGSIFVYSPILVFSLFGWKGFFRAKKKEAVLCFSIVGIFLLANAKLGEWFGLWGWGPRYTLEITPLMLLPLGFWLTTDRLKNKKIAFGDNSKMRFSVVRKVFYTFLHHKIKKHTFILICVYSLLIQLAANLTNWHARLGYLLARKGEDAFLFTVRYSQWWDSIKTLLINLWNLIFGSFLYLENPGYDLRISDASLYTSKTLFTWWNRLLFLGVNPFWIGAYFAITSVAIYYCLFYIINFIRKEQYINYEKQIRKLKK